jgi:putative transposase
MAQSLSRIYIHLVFSTKNRAPFLADPELRNNMFEYLAGSLRGMKCPAAVVGGTADHVQALFQFGRTIEVADLVGELKKQSSRWVKEKSQAMRGFYWQEGYGAFSVSFSDIKRVYDYIANQEKHHEKKTFQNEFRALLRKHELEWDERYVWD